MAILWDAKTSVEASDGLHLSDTSSELMAWKVVDERQQRIHGDLTFPLIKPLVWCFPRREVAAKEMAATPHVLRHVENAYHFADARTTASFRGDPGVIVPERLIWNDKFVGFNDERAARWKTFLSNELGLAENQITIEWLNGHQSFDCACKLIDPAAHDTKCLCRCSICTKARNLHCLCKEGGCNCMAICNCSCTECHSSVSLSSYRSLELALTTRIGSKRDLGQ